MCMSSPKPPAPVKPPPTPKQADPRVQAARNDERRRAASAQGRAGTILTSRQGLRDKKDGPGGTTLLGRSGN